MSDATLREIAPFMVDGVMIAEVTAQNGTGDLFMCQRWAGLSPATAAEYVNWLQRALCIADLSALQRRVEEMEGALKWALHHGAYRDRKGNFYSNGNFHTTDACMLTPPKEFREVLRSLLEGKQS